MARSSRKLSWLFTVLMGIDRIKRIPLKLLLRCQQKRKLRLTTDFRHNLPTAPNLSDQKFAASAPNSARVTDITH
jgi:putative transposase